MFNKEDRRSSRYDMLKKSSHLRCMNHPKSEGVRLEKQERNSNSGFDLYSAVTENQVETSLIKKRVETISVYA